MKLEALSIFLLFILFVGSVLILLTALANTKLTKEKKSDRLREQDISQAKPGSTNFSRGLQRKVW